MACRYGAEQGKQPVREALCRRFYEAAGRKASEIFVSDGSKCDIGRLQVSSSLAHSLEEGTADQLSNATH